MTLLIPLPDSPVLVQPPPNVVYSSHAAHDLEQIFEAIKSASTIVVVCGKCYLPSFSGATNMQSGAGISTAAGIPDFRSSNGLFRTLKKAHPWASFTNGKELFDICSLSSSATSEPFCKMIGELARQSHEAIPTAFHRLLRCLDVTGQLFRVYTQNIDCLEKKCGISFGLPDFAPRTTRKRSPSRAWCAPRCVPLHGRIDIVHCSNCCSSYPIAQYIDSFHQGILPPCSHCSDVEMLRPFTGKRSRGVGKLRPSITLYNEAHKFGDALGDIMSRDLRQIRARSQADDSIVLLVVGTSLQIPDVKSMVRNFAHILHSPHGAESRSVIHCLAPGQKLTTPASDTLRSIYINFDFPSSSREFLGVFDAWVHGDIEDFSRMMLSRYGA
jgi:NAD-dependent SIR2 family protein deacetylase